MCFSADRQVTVPDGSGEQSSEMLFRLIVCGKKEVNSILLYM